MSAWPDPSHEEPGRCGWALLTMALAIRRFAKQDEGGSARKDAEAGKGESRG